jgi:nitrate reductase delta subunit
MGAQTRHHTICGLYSRLLSYPDPELPEAAGRCGEMLAEASPRAAGELGRFVRFLEEQPASRVEELYTSTFDLQPSCYHYVGFQLCGESQKRTLFMIKLKEVYREHGFEAQGELPDHLSEMLAFLAVAQDWGVRAEIVADGLLPALDQLVKSFEDRNHPYGALLGSLQAFLEENPGSAGPKEVAS